MNIVVTFAVRQECAVWRRPELIPGIHAVLTGVGMRGSIDQLRHVLATADLCIASGFAGSLNKQLAVGSVLVARAIKTEANNTIVTSDGALVDAAKRCGAKVVDFFYTSKTVVNSSPERSRLAGIADAVDMESFHVLVEAQRAGIPAVAIRAISDSPEKGLPVDFNRVIDDSGKIAWLRMLAEVAKHPARITRLVRFGIESSLAARNLGTFLDRYVRFLRAQKNRLQPAEQMFR